jgi:ubiquinone/menaquinone biosynthesis C-methylase UbiE
MPAQMIADILLAGSTAPMKVLDIAAGHGIYGISIAQKNPDARVVAVDWPNVLQVAQENADKFGVADRYERLPGSAFDVDFGSGYEIILLTNFLHHFDPATNETLLRKVRQALKPGGRAATLEFVPNEDRVSPPFPAAFSMMMLGGTPAGDAYTFPELERMLANAGFASTTRHDLLPGPQTLLVSS